MKCHPDNNPGKSKEELAELSAKFLQGTSKLERLHRANKELGTPDADGKYPKCVAYDKTAEALREQILQVSMIVYSLLSL